VQRRSSRATRSISLGTDLRGDASRASDARTSSASYAFFGPPRPSGDRRLARWMLDPVVLFGSYTNGDTRNLVVPGERVELRAESRLHHGAHRHGDAGAGVALRLNPSRIHFRSGVVGSDASGSPSPFRFSRW